MFSITAPEQVEGLPLWPVIVVVVALIAFNVVNNKVAPEGHYLLWAFGGSFGLLAIGILDGNSWTDMGLGWSYLLPGLLWAAACIGVVTAAYLVAAAFRKGRDAMHDQRVAELSGPRLMFQALVQVPFGVVLFEEIAFRAVLFSMLARRFGVVWAVRNNETELWESPTYTVLSEPVSLLDWSGQVYDTYDQAKLYAWGISIANDRPNDSGTYYLVGAGAF